MKKLLAIVLLAVTVLSSCGSKQFGVDDFIESVKLDGVDWREYQTEDLGKAFNITGDTLGEYGKQVRVFDKIGDYTICRYWEKMYEMTEEIYILNPSQTDEYSTCISFAQTDEGYSIVDIRASKDYRLESYEKMDGTAHNEYVTCQQSVATYLEANNINTTADLLSLWGMSEIDEKVMEMVSDVETIGELSYELTCATKNGEATVTISNEAQDEMNRTIRTTILVSHKDGSTYTIEIAESNYEFYDEYYDDFSVSIRRPMPVVSGQ